MDSISIVIPFYNHYELLHSLLFDLYSKCRFRLSEVLLVNDGSTEKDVYEGISWWKKKKLLPIRGMDMEEDVGFLRASNAGIRKASGDIIVLLSDDVKIHDDFLPQVVSTLEANPKTLMGARLLDWDTGWNTFDGKTFPYLEGWLLAATKSAWQELGGFDDRFAPNDYEDIDLSTQAAVLGYSLVPLDTDKVEHLGGRTIGYSVEREAITKTNQRKFKEKWMN